MPWVHLTWNCLYARRGPPHAKKEVGSFWCRDIVSLSDNYMIVATCSINSGQTVMFWRDLWDLGVLQWRFLQLYSLQRRRIYRPTLFCLQKCDLSFGCLWHRKRPSSLLSWGSWLMNFKERKIWMTHGFIFGVPKLFLHKKHISIWVALYQRHQFSSGYGNLGLRVSTDSSSGS